MDYLRQNGIEVVAPLFEEHDRGKQRSKPIPEAVRQRIQGSVKFIELPGLPNRMAWQVGTELWINVSHPAMGRLYSRLREPSFINHPEHIETVEQLIHLLGRRFELALEITVARLALGAESR